MAVFYASDSQRLLVRFDEETGLMYINPTLNDWAAATPAVEWKFFRGDEELNLVSEKEAQEIFDHIKSID